VKLYRVRVEFETVILAESKEAAEMDAESIIKNEDDGAESVDAREISGPTDLPFRWNAQCRPWGETDPYDRTICEILSATAK
jgi:hypothetical protein